jgi:hypothetical protein
LCDGTHKQGGTGCTEASGLFCYASDTYGHCSKAPHPIVQLIRLGIGLSIVIFVYYTYRIWNFKRSSNSRTSSTTSHDQQIDLTAVNNNMASAATTFAVASAELETILARDSMGDGDKQREKELAEILKQFTPIPVSPDSNTSTRTESISVSVSDSIRQK